MYQAYQMDLSSKKSTFYKLTDLQWALGQFERKYNYAPSVYLKNPGTYFDGPFDGLFEDTMVLALGVVFLGPIREVPGGVGVDNDVEPVLATR